MFWLNVLSKHRVQLKVVVRVEDAFIEGHWICHAEIIKPELIFLGSEVV